MIKNLKWDQKYNLGIDAVDHQHQYFFDLIFRIYNGFTEFKNDNDHQKKLISELKAYATYHFISEENLAYQQKRPLLSDHHQRHLELLDELDRRANLLWLHPDDNADFFDFLINWFVGHTVYEDHRLFGVETQSSGTAQ